MTMLLLANWEKWTGLKFSEPFTKDHFFKVDVEISNKPKI